MHQPVYTSGQADKDTEIGYGFNLGPRTLSPLLCRGGKFLPGIRLTLLHTQRDTAPFLVNVQHDNVNLVTRLPPVFEGWIFLFVQSISDTCTNPSTPSFKLDETAIISQVGYRPVQTRSFPGSAWSNHPRDLLPFVSDPGKPGCVRWSNFNTLTSISSPMLTISAGSFTRFQAMSVMCSSPSMPPRSRNAP